MVELTGALRRMQIHAPVAVAMLAGCLLSMRGYSRLRYPAFFAEDGQIFLSQARNLGLAAIIEPYAGYLHVIPRIIAALLKPFPVDVAPLLYAIAALMAHLVMLTPSLSSRINWIIPGSTRRAVLFLLLCLIPPAWEVLGNIANLIFIGGITLLLLVISDDPRSGWRKPAELAGVAGLGMSGPLIVLFLPWFAWRWSRTRSRHSLAVGATAAMTAFVQGIILIRSGRQASGGSLVFLPRVWVERVGGGWLFGDLPLPNSPVLMFFWGGAFFWCVATVALTVVALGRTAAVLWLLHFTLLAAPVFAYGYMPPPLSWQRHLVVPVAIVVVLLTAVTGARRPYSIAAAVSLAIGLAAMVYDFLPAPYPYRPDLTWLHQCVKNQSFICRQAIFGDGWSIEIVR